MDTSMLHLDEMIALGYRGGKAADRCRLAQGVSRKTRQHQSAALAYIPSWGGVAGEVYARIAESNHADPKAVY